MDEDIVHIANDLIPPANGRIILKKNGTTPDIIAEVLAAFKDSREQLNEFAPHLRAANLRDTLYNVWKFWKQNVRYKVDPDNKQLVQEPQAFWAAPRTGDCKSFAVAVMGTLYNLGIKAAFRFASYSGNVKFPTHVYVVVLHNKKEIPVDCVWTEFGTQKAFTKKWDYTMETAIFRVSGLPGQAGKLKLLRQGKKLINPFGAVRAVSKGIKKGIDKKKLINPFGAVRVVAKGIKKGIDKKKLKPRRRGVLALPPQATEALAGVLLDKQYLEMQQIKHRQIHGIGTTHDHAFETQISAHEMAAIGLFGKGKKAVAKKTTKAKAANTAGKAVSKKQAKLLKKAGVTATKVKDGLLKRIAKGVTKVITTPARLALASQLPKNGAFFLYLFITDKKVLDKLPVQVVIKRQKALKYKSILVDKLQMKDENFTKAVRNGIMNTFGKPPESVLTEWMTAANFKVGFIDAAMNMASQGLKALLGKAAGQMAEDIENFTPAAEDWGTVPDATQQEIAVQQQAIVPQPLTMDQLQSQANSGTYTGGGSSAAAGSSYGSSSTAGSSEAPDIFANRGNNEDDATGETTLNDVTTEKGVVVKSGKQAVEDESNGGGNGLLLLAAGAVVLFAMSK